VSRSKLILISVAGMLMLAGSLYAQKPGTYSIAFNGYCDGLTVTISPNGFITGTHVNYDCAGDNTYVDGVMSLPIDRYDPYEYIGPIALSDNVGALEFGGSALMLYLNFSAGTFSFYLESDGVSPEGYINAGSISFSQSEVTGGGRTPASKRSTAPHAAAPNLVITGYPHGSYELLLSDSTNTYEYCDFFVLTAYGDLAGGLHDMTTVCDEPPNAATGGSYAFLTNGVVVMAAGGGVVGEAGRSLLTTENLDGETLNYYFNFNENIWSLYVTDGSSGLELVNMGFMTLVPYNPVTGKLTHPTGGTRSTTRTVH